MNTLKAPTGESETAEKGIQIMAVRNLKSLFLIFKSGLAILLLILASAGTLNAQIYSHNFGTTTISAHPYTVAPGTFNANLNSSSWTNSTGAWTSFAGSAGQAIALNNSSGTPTITLSFNVASGYELAVTSFSFWRVRSSTGATDWSMTINGISVGSGTFPTTGASTGTVNVSNTVSGLTGAINVVMSLSGASGTGTMRIDDFTLNGSVTAAGNTITTSAITGSPFAVTCSTGAAVSVPFTSTGTYTAGNVYTAQLSDGTGSFTNPVNIGTLTSTANSGTISATIPPMTASDNGYRIRVVSSTPVVTGTANGSNLTINLSGAPCQTIVINEVYVDAMNNDGSPNPNLGEWVELFNSSSVAIDLSCWVLCDGDFCVTFPAGTTIAAGGYLTIGSAAGSGCGSCDFPGATYNIDWGTCGCTSGTTVGTFTNSAEQLALFNSGSTLMDAVMWGGGQGLPVTMATNAVGSCGAASVTLPNNASNYEDIGVPVQGSSHERADDASTTWQMTSSPTLGSTNNTPLPVELINFSGSIKNRIPALTWSTASETNNAYFELLRSYDGQTFSSVTKTTGHGTSNTTHVYNHSDRSFDPSYSLAYYRLRQFDYDGKIANSEIITVTDVKSNPVSVFVTDENILITLESISESTTTISVFTYTGQQVQFLTIPAQENKTSFRIPDTAGMYFVTVSTQAGRYTSKVVVK